MALMMSLDRARRPLKDKLKILLHGGQTPEDRRRLKFKVGPGAFRCASAPGRTASFATETGTESKIPRHLYLSK